MKPLILAALATITLSACASAPAPTHPAALFVHGWASDARVWATTRERLSNPGVAVTLPGHGVPPAPGEISLEGFAGGIEAARIGAGAECVVLVAHSNGAYAALEYVRRYRERVASLIIVEGTFRPPFTDAGAFSDQIADVGSRWTSIQAHPLGLDGARAETIEAVREMFADTSPDTATGSLEALLALAPLEHQSISQPVLFILAQSPFWTEAELDALREAAPRSRFMTIAGASHWLPLDEPATIAQAVEAELHNVDCARPR